MKFEWKGPLGALVLPALLTLALTLISTPLAWTADPLPTRPAPRQTEPPIPPVAPIPPLPPDPPAIDPSTGLPLPSAQPWKDPSWPEPDKLLSEVTFDGLPLNQIGEYLQKEFRNAFDVIIPGAWRDSLNPDRLVDPQSLSISMQLKNVRATEVFHAMNLIFEAENTPCRWELRMNGNRPLAMVRVLPERAQGVQMPPPRPVMRTVYFVGDLISEGNQFGGDGPAMEQLVSTVTDVFQMSYGPAKGVVQFHQKSQLLVVTGNEEQIQFIQQTLSALREKAIRGAKLRPKAADSNEPKVSTDETKPRSTR